MASIWLRNTEHVTKTPGFYAFGSVLFAWLAGFDLRTLLYKVRMHNAEALDFIGPALLVVAFLWDYQVVRTIRQLSAGRPTSPTPLQTK